MNDIVRITMILAVATLGVGFSPARAQQPSEPEVAPDMVTLDFPENVQLKVLIDYVGKRANVNFIYDQATIQRTVTINAPRAVPTSSLMTLLESVLRMNNLALADTEIPGTMRIEAGKPLTNVSVTPGEVQEPRPTQAMTRVVALQHATPQQVETIIKPFLSATQATVATVAESKTLIITDYAHNMERIDRLIADIDQPRRDVAMQLVQLEHTEAAKVATQVTQILTSRARVSDGNAGRSRVAIQADERTNRLAIVGDPGEVADALELIKTLDVSLGLAPRVYRLENVSPDRIDRLMTELLAGPAGKSYRSVIDSESNSLIVTGTETIHAQVAELVASLDLPRSETQSPIRFYKLQNAKAADVLTTLQSIEGDAGLSDVSIDGVSADRAEQRDNYERITGPTQREVNNRTGIPLSATPTRTGLTLADEELGLSKARLLADEASNTIIVIARPAMQDVYERLIKRLDVRRPQVLIEATVVALDTTDGFRLGVEILRAGDVDDKGRYLSFSNFGLSEDVDPGSPGLVLSPGIGFNGAIISANIADIVIQALETDSRAKVVSKPSVLVNDNATGELISENEEPFSSVNASTTVSTTSFGGFASAGTTIRVTPQISEGDHLKLEYEIKLSSFAEASEETAAATAALPPARQTNSLISEATIPNGHTIVVGGLTRENFRETIDRVPILGHVPGLEYLFSNRSTTERQTTLFVFIKAVILRDDKFEYLKFVSGQAAAEAELASEFPDSQPVIMP